METTVTFTSSARVADSMAAAVASREAMSSAPLARASRSISARWSSSARTATMTTLGRGRTNTSSIPAEASTEMIPGCRIVPLRTRTSPRP